MSSNEGNRCAPNSVTPIPEQSPDSYILPQTLSTNLHTMSPRQRPVAVSRVCIGNNIASYGTLLNFEICTRLHIILNSNLFVDVVVCFLRLSVFTVRYVIRYFLQSRRVMFVFVSVSFFSRRTDVRSLPGVQPPELSRCSRAFIEWSWILDLQSTCREFCAHANNGLFLADRVSGHNGFKRLRIRKHFALERFCLQGRKYGYTPWACVLSHSCALHADERDLRSPNQHKQIDPYLLNALRIFYFLR